MKQKRKLQFSKESVRVLTGSDLQQAIGGHTTVISCTGGCDTDVCDTDVCDTDVCGSVYTCFHTTFLSCGGGCDTA